MKGNGIRYYEDGEYYKGQFNNSFRHGKGKLFYKNGNVKYDGDWINDIGEGEGHFIMKGVKPI